MKLSIEGFNQRYALSLVKTVPNRDSEKIIRIDCTDLVILRWFVDFYPKMEKINADGKEYAWLSYKKLHEDLPILNISKRSVAERLKKLVEFEILDYKIMHEAGNMTYYSFGKNYDNLITDDSQMQSNAGFAAQTAMVNESVDGGLLLKQHSLCSSNTSNKSINNKSINISTSKSNKLDLSVDTGSDEPSEYYDNSLKNDNNEVSVYEKTENNANNVSGAAMPEKPEVDVSKEQNEVDKINALKILKRDKSKKSNKNNKDTPFHKCVNIINNRSDYSKSLKDLLYKYLQFRITCTHSDPTAWEALLDSLDNLVSSSPTNDINELNYLKEQIVLKSLQCEYRKFYSMSDTDIAQHLTQYRESVRDYKTDLEGLEIRNHGKVDTSKLATNEDGSPMIF